MEPLTEHREAQHRTFLRYRGTALTDQAADDVILTLYRDGVINVSQVAEMVRQGESPHHAG